MIRRIAHVPAGKSTEFFANAITHSQKVNRKRTFVRIVESKPDPLTAEEAQAATDQNDDLPFKVMKKFFFEKRQTEIK